MNVARNFSRSILRKTDFAPTASLRRRRGGGGGGGGRQGDDRGKMVITSPVAVLVQQPTIEGKASAAPSGKAAVASMQHVIMDEGTEVDL